MSNDWQYTFYNGCMSLAASVGAAYLSLSSGRKPLLGRFSPVVPKMDGRPIWVHACSVGEVGLARTLLTAMDDRWPDIPRLLTVSTLTGKERAVATCNGVPITWCPFDRAGAVKRFVASVKPRALVLIETEVWPNLVRETWRYGAPVIIVNGRLTDKHYRRYLYFRSFVNSMFSLISAVGAQSEEYASRFVELGVLESGVQVTGSCKFDGLSTAVSREECEQLRNRLGVSEEKPIVVFGSTRSGDEAFVKICSTALQNEFPDVLLVAAPRHLTRLNEVFGALDGVNPVRWSEVRDGKRKADGRVLVVDTMGDLLKFYAIATVAVIGGSFKPGIEGHNPLEPAALGVPTLFGRYMHNLPAQVLLENRGAHQVMEPEQLPEVLGAFLRDAVLRNEIGMNGCKAVAENQGAVQRDLDLIEAAVFKKKK